MQSGVQEGCSFSAPAVTQQGPAASITQPTAGKLAHMLLFTDSIVAAMLASACHHKCPKFASKVAFLMF